MDDKFNFILNYIKFFFLIYQFIEIFNISFYGYCQSTIFIISSKEKKSYFYKFISHTFLFISFKKWMYALTIRLQLSCYN